MPLYEYQCEACEKRFERIQKFSDPLVATCPTCGAAVRKLPSSPAIQFKGSGFYINDYAKKSGTSGDGKPAKGGGDTGDKASEKSAEKGSDKSSDKSSDASGGKSDTSSTASGTGSGSSSGSSSGS